MLPHSPPPISLPTRKIDVALALGGGGSKGFALAGVLEVLQRAHIPIHLIVGTSAGSIVGALYADHPDGKALAILLLHTKRQALMTFTLMHPGDGVIRGYRLQNFLLKHMHAKYFKDLKIPFVAVATDFQTGRSVSLASGPVAPAVNASAAVPGLFFPVSLYHKVLVDGGLSQPVPTLAAASYHPKLLIAVNINNQPPLKVPSGFFKRLMRAYNFTENNLTQLQLHRADVVIEPKVGNVGIIDGSQRYKVYLAGRAAALRALPRIRALMKARHIAPAP